MPGCCGLCPCAALCGSSLWTRFPPENSAAPASPAGPVKLLVLACERHSPAIWIFLDSSPRAFQTPVGGRLDILLYQLITTTWIRCGLGPPLADAEEHPLKMAK